MSGGAYNYVSLRDFDSLLSHIEDMEDLADDLEDLGYANDLAAVVFSMLQDIELLKRKVSLSLRQIGPALQTFELWESDATSEDNFKKALEQWRNL